MVEVKIGTIIKKETLKSGVSGDRKWMFGTVSAESGYDRIKVWAKNPDVGTNSDVTVASISQAKITNRKYTKQDGTEAWATDFNIEADLKAINAIPEGFSQLDDSIPF